jgi:hypothetical protein
MVVMSMWFDLLFPVMSTYWFTQNLPDICIYCIHQQGSVNVGSDTKYPIFILHNNPVFTVDLSPCWTIVLLLIRIDWTVAVCPCMLGPLHQEYDFSRKMFIAVFAYHCCNTNSNPSTQTKSCSTLYGLVDIVEKTLCNWSGWRDLSALQKLIKHSGNLYVTSVLSLNAIKLRRNWCHSATMSFLKVWIDSKWSRYCCPVMGKLGTYDLVLVELAEFWSLWRSS